MRSKRCAVQNQRITLSLQAERTEFRSEEMLFIRIKLNLLNRNVFIYKDFNTFRSSGDTPKLLR